MNFEEIAESITLDDREYIKNVVKENNYNLFNYSRHKPDSIQILYDEWHKIFPRHKQDINCSDCRKAVIKFWDEICLKWTQNV
tara:strand:- start:514 stop:762 length:249 start_codon:yes stop_codon:yes gene_type:complete